MKKYLLGFANKMLCEVVIPGSHDAGIYDRDTIGPTGLTQNLDILQQANAGVRWFDIRVAGDLRGNQVEHKAFHKALAGERTHKGSGKEYLKGGLGGYGGELGRMLRDAEAFVTANPSECLIFKISKSQNVAHIYRQCKEWLGTSHFAAPGIVNLNTRQFGTLGGKVITLFSEDDVVTIRGTSRNQIGYCDGAFAYKELYKQNKLGQISVKAYADNFRGLQYFGKFSQTNYYGINKKKQRKNMRAGVASGVSPNVMGMMYWTLTSSIINPLSLPENIQERNKDLWIDRHALALKKMWEEGLRDSIQNHMGQHRFFNNATGRHDWNGFIPNVIMIDFADPTKCQQIFNLNHVRNQIVDELVR